MKPDAATDRDDRARTWLRDAAAQPGGVCVLTGAGMSAESGIPTFRDAMSGLWSQFDPGQLATQEGYLADPIHGGNKNMGSWKMIGFPGTRADFIDWVEKYGARYPLSPVGIAGRKG